MSLMNAKTLYRPVGPAELKLIAESGYRFFPARLPGQPIFYPVCAVEYAREIAQKWNVAESGAGYVTAFDVDAHYLAKYEIHQAGNRTHLEYWIPAEDLQEFNRHIIGPIRVVESYGEPKFVTIYVELLDEGVDCWRPVLAEPLSDGLYRIADAVPEDETWLFQPGDVVRAEPRRFDREAHITACEKVTNE